MTDRELLELIFNKVTGIESKISNTELEISGMKSQISGMSSEISGIKPEISNIKSQQVEHTAMIQALIHASELQKAETEGIKMELTKLSGEQAAMREETQSAIKALTDMYGQHEFEIEKLRRRSV